MAHRVYVPDFIGGVYLVLGVSIILRETFDLANADYVFTSEQENELLGLTVAGIGDYDGDCLDELLCGADWHSTGTERAHISSLIWPWAMKSIQSLLTVGLSVNQGWGPWSSFQAR